MDKTSSPVSLPPSSEDCAPVAVVMITLNEGHNLEAVLDNIQDWAQEIFIVDSYSNDETVEIALRRGINIVQRAFRGFGDQWNFALEHLPIKAKWTMKLDPDERVTDSLKRSISQALKADEADAFIVPIRLWFLQKKLPIRLKLLRIWRTGSCRFSDVSVNEHLLAEGKVESLSGEIEHLDSPSLFHWIEKQNRYTTAEAVMAYNQSPLSDIPRFMGTGIQRRMWLKKIFFKVPGRYVLLFLYYWLVRGTWRAGFPGYAWARMRADVMRLIEYKRREMDIVGNLPVNRAGGPGEPDPRVKQFD